MKESTIQDFINDIIDSHIISKLNPNLMSKSKSKQTSAQAIWMDNYWNHQIYWTRDKIHTLLKMLPVDIMGALKLSAVT